MTEPAGPVVVVGANLAGGTVAATLRTEGFDGPIVLIGEETLPPYERPPMSKEHLRGEQELADAFIRPDGWWEEQGIDTRFGRRAVAIDTSARSVELDGGERVDYATLVLAMGCRNRRFPIPGLELPGVFDLRTAGDSRRIREAAREVERAVVVGMGFIGAEVAASIRSYGVAVTAVEFAPVPLARVVGPQVGEAIRALHADHGVEMFFNEGIERFEGGDRVEEAVTTSGRRLPCDMVVVGVGVQPNEELAKDAGIPCDNGVLVDATLASEVPGVWAVGDVASHDHPVFGRIRVEHFDNALKTGEHVGRNILGRPEVFDDVHWFWSDQYDANIQMSGFAKSWDELVIRGSLEDRTFSAFYLEGGVLRSALSMNRPREVRRAMPLIRAAIRPDRDALADESVDLRTLVPGS